MSISYWRPQVMRHRRPEGGFEYAMHDVYFDDDGRVETYTVHARSARLPSRQALKAWSVENLPTAQRGIVCGDLGYTHDDADLELWLKYFDDPPIDYKSN